VDWPDFATARHVRQTLARLLARGAVPYTLRSGADPDAVWAEVDLGHER
jgi:hypothetical protein